MKKIIIPVLALTIIAGCTKNKDKENYYNLQLNFKKEIEKNYITNIEMIISSIELDDISPAVKRIINHYTKNKEINSAKANIRIEHKLYIEEIDKDGGATIKHKTNNLTIETLQINNETININYPYQLAINKNNITKQKISKKGKIISPENINEDKKVYYALTKLINKSTILPNKIQIGKQWKYKNKETYSFNRKANSYNFSFDIIGKSTLNNIENNIIDISSEIRADVDVYAKLKSISIDANVIVNTDRQTIIDNTYGLEKEGKSTSTFNIEGTIIPADYFSRKHKEDFGEPKFKAKGKINYKIVIKD